MKARIVKAEERPVYEKRDIIITLESYEDEAGLRHLMGCWGNPDRCDSKELVQAVLNKLFPVYDSLVAYVPGNKKGE